VLERLVYPAIGNVPLGALKRSHIITMLDQIEDASGVKMADLTLAYVRKILNWHESRTDDFNSPITRGMSRYNGRAAQRRRTLSDDELRAIWQATEEPAAFHRLIRFILLTGCRRAEATGLRWSEVANGKWTLPAERNKTKVELTRPLSGGARAIVESMPVIGDGELVFSLSGDRVMDTDKPLARLKRQSGTEGWCIHDLRRTARTFLSRAGVNTDVAELCLGHVIGGVRAVYDRHDYENEMQHAFEQLAALITRIVEPPPSVVTPLRKRSTA
jgi:integrase